MSGTRVLLADDQPLVRSGLRVAAYGRAHPERGTAAATPRPALVKVCPWRPLATNRSVQG
ncbi:hypothetical protein [Streptomyces sp. NPDC097981]|uniref:hypothetical protein n=1 Tax=Streptomyces sp. NPDC097981 TaxID=3155428 RepID=UPI003331ABEC